MAEEGATGQAQVQALALAMALAQVQDLAMAPAPALAMARDPVWALVLLAQDLTATAFQAAATQLTTQAACLRLRATAFPVAAIRPMTQPACPASRCQSHIRDPRACGTQHHSRVRSASLLLAPCQLSSSNALNHLQKSTSRSTSQPSPAKLTATLMAAPPWVLPSDTAIRATWEVLLSKWNLSCARFKRRRSMSAPLRTRRILLLERKWLLPSLSIIPKVMRRSSVIR